MDVEQIANQIEGVAHVIHCIADGADDEGDRVFFASTNDPHALVRQHDRLIKIALAVRAYLKDQAND